MFTNYCISIDRKYKFVSLDVKLLHFLATYKFYDSIFALHYMKECLFYIAMNNFYLFDR